MEKQRLAAIDGMRAIFGIIIVIYHVNGLFGSVFSSILMPIYEYGGYFGNYMFFIISGLLISLRYKDLLIDGKCRFGTFIGKRICRIYPVYFLSNIVMILWGGVEFTLRKTCTTFLMVSSGWFWGEETPYNFPAWFICVLMICYIFYFVIGKISCRFPVCYKFLCATFIIWGAVLEIMDWNVPFQYRVCGEGYMNFFFGVLLAEAFSPMIHQDTKPIKNVKFVRFAKWCAFLYIGIMMVFILTERGLPGDMRWWISFACVGLIVIVLSEGMLARFFSLSFFQAIGKCSLSLTLWHIPLARCLQGFIVDSGLDFRVSFILYLFLVVAVAFFSCHYLEDIFYFKEQS